MGDQAQVAGDSRGLASPGGPPQARSWIGWGRGSKGRSAGLDHEATNSSREAPHVIEGRHAADEEYLPDEHPQPKEALEDLPDEHPHPEAGKNDAMADYGFPWTRRILTVP